MVPTASPPSPLQSDPLTASWLAVCTDLSDFKLKNTLSVFRSDVDDVLNTYQNKQRQNLFSFFLSHTHTFSLSLSLSLKN